MGYFIQMTIPANTSIGSPVLYTLPIQPCIVRRVELTFPTGCASLTGLWFVYRAARLWPTNDGEVFRGNGSPIVFEPDSELVDPPYDLEIYGHNEDDTYQHKPLIQLDVDFVQYDSGVVSRVISRLLGDIQGLGG